MPMLPKNKINFAKKIILSLLSALVIFFSFAPYLQVAAQEPPAQAPTAVPTGTWYNQGFTDWFSKVYDENVSPSNEIFGERYTAAQVQWVVYSLLALLINTSGPAGTQAVSCLMAGDINSCGAAIKEAINSVTLSDAGGPNQASVFAMNPLSGIGYVQRKIDNFHLVPVAHAQGFGYNTAESPVQQLWVAIRNISFGLIILVVIVMAFMIMFRVKISPQVVITVQSALPKIIGALILITFSYAIAGFVIDLMYVVMGLLATFVSSTGSGISSLSAVELFKYFNSQSIIVLSLQYILYFFLGITGTFAGWGAELSSTNQIISGGGSAIAGIVGIFFGLIILLVLGIVVIWSLLKIMWMLLITYVNILLKIIFGPLQILIGTVTSFGGFGAWLKSLAADLSVFPVVSFLFFLAFFFMAQTFKASYGNIELFGIGDALINNFPFRINANFLATSAGWAPPMTVGAQGLGLLWLGVSVSIMTLIPKTGEIIKGIISGKPISYGTAIGEAFGPVSMGGRGALAARAGRAEAAESKSAEQEGREYTTPGWVQAARTIGLIRK